MSPKPALRPELAVGDALRAIAHDILSDARKAIESPDNSDAVAVHEFRREMKRWRALLRLLEPFLGDESEGLQTTARDLARDLGGARDPQSALDALDDLGHELPLSERSIKTVRKRIDALRTAGEMSALTADMRLRIAEALADAEASVDRWPLDDLNFSDIAKQLAASYRALRRAMPDRWSDASPETLHELRKLRRHPPLPDADRRSRCGNASPRCGSRRRSGCASGSASIRISRSCGRSTEPQPAAGALAHAARAGRSRSGSAVTSPLRNGSRRACSWTSPARSGAG